MKIKLEKAYKKATKGPLALGLETNEEDAQLINAEGWHVATVAISPHKETAALLAHAFNVLPEVVAALEDAREFILRFDESDPEKLAASKRISDMLDKAASVEIPE